MQIKKDELNEALELLEIAKEALLAAAGRITEPSQVDHSEKLIELSRVIDQHWLMIVKKAYEKRPDSKSVAELREWLDEFST